MSDPTHPTPLKEWFDHARLTEIADHLAKLSPRFSRRRFLDVALEDLAERSLMQRMHQCAVAAETALPGTYRQKLRPLRRLAPRLGHEFVAIFLSDFVASYGLDDFDHSLDALRFFTVFGSAEFAVRPFLVADQARTLTTMHQWTRDPHEKVRRLASEGSRPRLPWGLRLAALVRDPTPTRDILETLKDDPSASVRRSVANHLNDITKDHPEIVLDQLTGWDLERAHLQSIARHACRTLIKRGHPEALRLFGFGRRPDVVATLRAIPDSLRLGDRLTLQASLKSTSARRQRLAVDYVVHYVKSGGSTSEKVFKWCEVELPPRGTVELTKSQVIRDFTTRRHYAGRHRVELQVNGIRSAATAFQLHSRSA